MTNPQVRSCAQSLTDVDLDDLSRSATDLSDVDPHALARAQASFRYAYRVAQRVSDGTLDLSPHVNIFGAGSSASDKIVVLQGHQPGCTGPAGRNQHCDASVGVLTLSADLSPFAPLSVRLRTKARAPRTARCVVGV